MDLPPPNVLTVSCTYTQTLTYPIWTSLVTAPRPVRKKDHGKNFIRQSSVKNRPLALVFPPTALTPARTLPLT